MRMLVAGWMFASSLIAIAALRHRPAPEMWSYGWEFVKVVIGPAIGAGIAFYVNDYVHRQRKKEVERTAIYGASYAIGSMYEDFLNLKVAIREMLAEADEQYTEQGITNTNINAYARPQTVTFLEKNSVNSSTLHFLLTLREGVEAFQTIQYLTRLYTDLITIHQSLNDALIERQKIFDTASEQDLEKSEVELIGQMLFTRVNDFLMALVERLEKDEKVYIAATDNLATAADAYLGEVTPLKHRGFKNQKFLDENMKPLPRIFVDVLKYGMK